MKAWRRSARLALLAGLMMTLGLAIDRGQALSRQVPICPVQQSWTSPAPRPGEPPLAEAPPSMPPADAPMPPFTAPPPTPLGPGESGPVPGVPFVGPEPMDLPVPVVRLRVRAPAEIQPEKEIEYRLIVENVSRAAAHHVVVHDRLPPRTDEKVRAEPKPTRQTKNDKTGTTDLFWELGTLKPGERKEIVLAIKPTGTDDVRNSAYVQFEHGQAVNTRIARPRVQFSVSAPAQAMLHDSISFQLEVRNTGPDPVKDVIVTDELPDGLEFINGKPYPAQEKPLTWKLGELAPGQSRRIEYQAISKKAGTWANKAQLKAAGGVQEKASASVTVGEAKLSIHKSGPHRRLVNRPTPYQITIHNPGTMPATNVQVSDLVPSGIDLVSASPGGRRERGFVRWSLGTLRPGEQRTLEVVIRAPRPGRYGNVVQAQADHNLTVKAQADETHFEAASGPALEIDKSADSLEVGQKMRCTIRLLNAGKLAFLGARLLISVPEEMTASNPRGPTSATIEGQTIRFGPLQVLAPGSEETYAIELEAKKAGEARLRVELTDGRKEPEPQSWEEKILIRPAPRLAPHPVSPALQVRTRSEPEA